MAKFDILSKRLTEYGFQLVSEIFAAVCVTHGVNKSNPNNYYRQTHGYSERFNSTLISRLRYSVPEDRMDYDLYLLALTMAYTEQVHGSIK